MQIGNEQIMKGQNGHALVTSDVMVMLKGHHHRINGLTARPIVLHVAGLWGLHSHMHA